MVGCCRSYLSGTVGSVECDSILTLCGSGDAADEILITFRMSAGQFRRVEDIWCVFLGWTILSR